MATQEDLDSARIARLVQEGDQQAFNQLCSRYFDRVYAYLHVALGCSLAAERATEETFAGARLHLRESGGLPLRPSFRAWLFAVAGATVAGRECEDVARLPAGAVPGGDPLLAGLAELPSDQRQVVALRYMLGFTITELAAALGCHGAQVRALHHRAMLALSGTLPARAAA
jgi:RNA polymerase sigma-70 factor (ECF subfamily)